jgi:hypothetical protein
MGIFFKLSFKCGKKCQHIQDPIMLFNINCHLKIIVTSKLSNSFYKETNNIIPNQLVLAFISQMSIFNRFKKKL